MIIEVPYKNYLSSGCRACSSSCCCCCGYSILLCPQYPLIHTHMDAHTQSYPFLFFFLFFLFLVILLNLFLVPKHFVSTRQCWFRSCFRPSPFVLWHFPLFSIVNLISLDLPPLTLMLSSFYLFIPIPELEDGFSSLSLITIQAIIWLDCCQG